MGNIGKYFTLEQIQSKRFGVGSLVPIIDMQINENIFNLLSTLYNLSPDIKLYLPGLDFSTPKKTASKLAEYGLATHTGLQVSYIMCIEGKPIGITFINTPDYNQAKVIFPHWSIDFCIFVPFSGHGYMSSFLPHILNMLKCSFNVDELFAIVDQRNDKSLSLLSNFGFYEWRDNQGTFFDPNTGNCAKVLCCKLETINFKRG